MEAQRSFDPMIKGFLHQGEEVLVADRLAREVKIGLGIAENPLLTVHARVVDRMVPLSSAECIALQVPCREAGVQFQRVGEQSVQI